MYLSFHFKHTLSIRMENTEYLCGKHPGDQHKNGHKEVLAPGNTPDGKRFHLTNDPQPRHSRRPSPRMEFLLL